MKKIIYKILLGCISLFIVFPIYAQQTVVSLYKGVAPGSEDWTQKEMEYTQWGGKMVRNVVKPTLTIYLPEENKSTGTAIIVAPGGGFGWLSWENEGTLVGEWLQAHGIAAFILKYRLADTGQTEEEFQRKQQEIFSQVINVVNSNNPEEELKKYSNMSNVIALAKKDIRQALKYVRSNADGYKINKDRIGLMGFSAGGVLTMDVAIHHDEQSRPNFIAPIYTPNMHVNIPVPDDAAPMFIVCAADDELVAPKAYKFYNAWKSAGKNIEFHVYSKGSHGFGMIKRGLPIDNWIEHFGEWLNVEGFLKR
jgi:acetyl esterase/lipase